MAPPKTKSHALRSYDVTDFPALTGREEEWRFTPLPRLRGLDSEVTPASAAAPKHEYGQLPAGVTVSTVDRSDERIGSILVPFDRISALAFGASERALLVSVAAESIVDSPVSIKLVGDLSGSARVGRGGAGKVTGDEQTFGHTYVEIGDLAEATVVLDHQGSITLADNVEVLVGAGAKLTFVTVADWARDAVQAQHVKFRLGRDARVRHVHVSLGGDLVRQYVSVEYADRGGDCEAYGLYFAGPGQHFEHRLLVDHGVPNCRSYVAYRGALSGEGAHTVWVGDVLIQTEATGTDTYEINRNLVMTDGAQAVSVPNLEIETGEVIGAGHASATGRFDDEQLFYLMSRGIREEDARRLVVRGFFAELLGKIPVEELRERLARTVDGRLGG
jgi:Fe-S cluster assembly protein SufD